MLTSENIARLNAFLAEIGSGIPKADVAASIGLDGKNSDSMIYATIAVLRRFDIEIEDRNSLKIGKWMSNSLKLSWNG